MPMILSGETPINVETAGDDRRPALVLINPLGATLDIWEPMMAQLVEHNYVIRFDQRGHGGSPLPDEPFDLADLGHDVLNLLDVLEVPRTHVLGASLGGFVATWLAANHPERIDRVVLVSTAPRLGPDYWWQRTIATVEDRGLEGMIDHLDRVFFSERYIESQSEPLDASRQMMLATPPAAYLAGARVILDCDSGPLLERIRASTLLIVGSDDPVLQHHPAEDILARIPDSEAVLVEGARHRVFLEQPHEIAEVIGEFLTDPDGR